VARRALILVVLVVAALAAVLWQRRPVPQAGVPRAVWVATAHQHGPVGYRDPAAAISPDGRWVAYSEGRFLRVQPIGGGPVVDLPPGEQQFRQLAWHPDNERILAGGAVYDRIARTQEHFPVADNKSTSAEDTADKSSARERLAVLRQAVWSPDGQRMAAVINGREGSELWILPAGGGTPEVTRVESRASFAAWTPDSRVACIAILDGRSRVTVPCGTAQIRIDPDLDVYGPIAFSPDGATVYGGMPNTDGTLDLWAIPVAGGRARKLSAFSRDSYAPTVAADGTVLFKSQSYRTAVATAPADGGPTQPLAAFQSETPSWDPTGRWIGITYGTWRRVVDDVHYPDIAQEVGIIAADVEEAATRPVRVVHDSNSEDQSLCWSPNGKWIAFHSHKEQSDDIWLRPAEGNGAARRISLLGRGAETGWPRWSADGKWLLFEGASKTTRRSVLYVAGLSQDTGEVYATPAEIAIAGLDAEVIHGEWLPDSDHIVAIVKHGPGRHGIITTTRTGADLRTVHNFFSEHDAPGLGVSPNGRDVAFIAPAADGFFQVFRMPIAGGEPRQVTTDPSNKTQPAWSPDGRRIAFTVWNYDAQLWTIRP
jgi:Tol biopolymer transport system component